MAIKFLMKRHVVLILAGHCTRELHITRGSLQTLVPHGGHKRGLQLSRRLVSHGRYVGRRSLDPRHTAQVLEIPGRVARVSGS